MTNEERESLYQQMMGLPQWRREKLLKVLFMEMRGCEDTAVDYPTDDFFNLIEAEIHIYLNEVM